MGALLQRERTGEGAYIDVSMLDASLAFMTSALTPYLVTGNAMKRLGNTGYSGLPTADLFETQGRAAHFAGRCAGQPVHFAGRGMLGREDWLDDPRFATPDARRANFDAMAAELRQIFATRDAAEWEAQLSEAGHPLRHDQTGRRSGRAVQRGGAARICRSTSIPGVGPVAVPNIGFTMKPGDPGTDQPPPRIDEHREEILAWLARE